MSNEDLERMLRYQWHDGNGHDKALKVVVYALAIGSIVLVLVGLSSCVTVEPIEVAPTTELDIRTAPGTVDLTLDTAPIGAGLERIGAGLERGIQVLGDGMSQAVLMIGEQGVTAADRRAEGIVGLLERRLDKMEYFALGLLALAAVATLAFVVDKVAEARRERARRRLEELRWRMLRQQYGASAVVEDETDEHDT